MRYKDFQLDHREMYNTMNDINNIKGQCYIIQITLIIGICRASMMGSSPKYTRVNKNCNTKKALSDLNYNLSHYY